MIANALARRFFGYSDREDMKNAATRSNPGTHSPFSVNPLTHSQVYNPHRQI